MYGFYCGYWFVFKRLSICDTMYKITYNCEEKCIQYFIHTTDNSLL